MKPAPRNRFPRMYCPHCGALCLTRSSVGETPLSREVRMRCDNDECGFSFVAQLVVLRELSPSAVPNPDIRIPRANQNLRGAARRPSNDDVPDPANDDHQHDTPAAKRMNEPIRE